MMPMTMMMTGSSITDMSMIGMIDMLTIGSTSSTSLDIGMRAVFDNHTRAAWQSPDQATTQRNPE